MKTLSVLYLCVLLALLSGGCGSQPSAKAEGEYDVAYTLKTAMADGRMVYVGAGGAIEGVPNPELPAQPGDRIQLTLVNGDSMMHDLAIPELGGKSEMTMKLGDQVTVTVEASQTGTFVYYCTVPGHRQAGMEGKLVVR